MEASKSHQDQNRELEDRHIEATFELAEIALHYVRHHAAEVAEHAEGCSVANELLYAANVFDQAETALYLAEEERTKAAEVEETFLEIVAPLESTGTEES